VGGFMRQVGLIVRTHHERWDGTGYPDGLEGEAIPIEARIISSCDAYNAMRTDRPYRKAMPKEEAIAELVACAGKQFDPAVVDAVLSVVDGDGGALASRLGRDAEETDGAESDSLALLTIQAERLLDRGPVHDTGA
jgi:HD-GYP domain-containing protein (c-di-GMP phosphodiesterase class II)